MTFDDIMAMERNALLREYAVPIGFARINVPPYVAVPDFDVLKATPSELRARCPIDVEHLKNGQPGQAFVQICPSLNYRFLWTHVDNNKYRDDYLTYIRDYHYMPVTSLPQGLHVDHLFNRARARSMQLPFVRMALLPASINCSHGAGYERSRTRGGIGTPGNQKGIDEIVLMKLFGIASPGKDAPLRPEIFAHLTQMSVMFGIPVAELERNVRELMDVAAFRPG